MNMRYFKNTTTGDVHGYDATEASDMPYTEAAITAGWQEVTGNWPPAPALSDVKTARVALLSDACAAQIYAGFQSSALGTVHTYPANDKDQANLSSSVVASLLPALAANWTTPFWCMDSAGNWAFVPHTAAQIQQVGIDGKAAIVAALERNAALAAQVMAATTATGVEAVVW